MEPKYIVEPEGNLGFPKGLPFLNWLRKLRFLLAADQPDVLSTYRFAAGVLGGLGCLKRQLPGYLVQGLLELNKGVLAHPLDAGCFSNPFYSGYRKAHRLLFKAGQLIKAHGRQTQR